MTEAGGEDPRKISAGIAFTMLAGAFIEVTGQFFRSDGRTSAVRGAFISRLNCFFYLRVETCEVPGWYAALQERSARLHLAELFNSVPPSQPSSPNMPV